MEDKNNIYFKKLIEDEIENLDFELKELEETCKPIPPDDAYGRISRMDAIHQKSRNESLFNDAKIRMVNLKLALKKINNNEYGICKVCKIEISNERLMFVPETDKCKVHA